MQISFPFSIAPTGRVVTASRDAHIKQMIAQVLFTRPGERVNRPDFGCGLAMLVFEPGNSELTAVTQATVRGALTKWLGDLIHVDKLAIDWVEEKLTVRISYAVLGTLGATTVEFTP